MRWLKLILSTMLSLGLAAATAILVGAVLLVVAYWTDTRNLGSVRIRSIVAFMATGLILGSSMLVLFTTALKLSRWSAVPPGFAIALVCVVAGAAMHDLLGLITEGNGCAFGVSVPYSWLEENCGAS